MCVLFNPLNIRLSCHNKTFRKYTNSSLNLPAILPEAVLAKRTAHCHIWKGVVKDRSNVFLKRIKSPYLEPAVRVRMDKIRQNGRHKQRISNLYIMDHSFQLTIVKSLASETPR